MNPASLRLHLEALLKQYSIPAAGVAISRANEPLLVAVAGTRAADSPEPVAKTDLWHIGSCAKAITATALLRLSERGQIDLNAPLAELLRFEASDLHAAYQQVTLCHLLSHTAGLPAFTSEDELKLLEPLIDAQASPREQRACISRHYLALQPPGPIGEYSYSNLGFVIAGHLAEHRLGIDWETLLNGEIFQPLDIQRAGWGAPRGKPGQPDQPRGHLRQEGTYTSVPAESPLSDNPALWAPAGTLHLQLQEWMLYCRDQLDGRSGRGVLLTEAGYRKQHTPLSETYALGWGVQRGTDAQPTLLTHTGSNALWLADARIFLKRDLILLCVLSAGDEVAENALRDLLRFLLKEYLH